jgi:PleD family two-component response regulator
MRTQPKRTVAASSRIVRHSLREAPRTGRVLLVEDDRVNQVVARRLLERRGYTVVVAADGREALSTSATRSRSADRPTEASKIVARNSDRLIGLFR